ncbi:MAG: response regulator transcription factor [Clostridiales bacterium]|jgi:DNA-binding response OmpR family regulator|nr:response regulator transcription factor [Clostridiales bacterium]
MAKLLIVEDEPAIAELIALHAQIAGHSAAVLHDGGGVMRQIDSDRPDMIILDVMLPGRDGFSLMADIAPTGVPVIFLTAKERLEDKVNGLRLGADDYIVKPFEAIELMTRIDAVLRRCRVTDGRFHVGGAEIWRNERRTFYNGQEIELTFREFGLLEALIRNKNLALSREKLLELVWGYNYLGETRTVDVHIQKLRKKLGLEEYIKTVYKYGYRLEVPR